MESQPRLREWQNRRTGAPGSLGGSVEQSPGLIQAASEPNPGLYRNERGSTAWSPELSPPGSPPCPRQHPGPPSIVTSPQDTHGPW